MVRSKASGLDGLEHESHVTHLPVVNLEQIIQSQSHIFIYKNEGNCITLQVQLFED